VQATCRVPHNRTCTQHNISRENAPTHTIRMQVANTPINGRDHDSSKNLQTGRGRVTGYASYRVEDSEVRVLWNVWECKGVGISCRGLGNGGQSSGIGE